MKLTEILNYLSTARTEYQSLGMSVFGSFVVPFYLEGNDLAKTTHSTALEGSRGCGKTMYLRYFSHWTQFDPRRTDVSTEDLKTIILYWKPDTVYCRALSQSWLNEANARQFFLTLTALELFDEFLSALNNIWHHFPDLLKEINTGNEFWGSISSITGENISDLKSAKSWIAKNKFIVHGSINANKTSSLPLLDPKSLLNYLLPILRRNSPSLSETRFKIFVDEFENLAEFQQKIINSYRKHSDLSLSWNVAHKTNARISAQTDGDEQLQQPNDYRTITLDDFLLDKEKGKENSEYELLASEVLILSFQKAGLECSIPSLSPEALGDRNALIHRRSPEYHEKVLKLMEKIMPTPTIKELAKLAVQSKSTRNRIEEVLKKLPDITPEVVNKIIREAPDVAITTWSVCNQTSFTVDALYDYIEKGYPASHAYNQKVSTYLYGALLSLNLQYSYIDIPVYAGFSRFCSMSKGNIRHFIELCYHSIKHQEYENQGLDIDSVESYPQLEYKFMHVGAKAASVQVVKEVPNFSPSGQTLFAIVNRLGDLFQMAQRSKVQSEPEQNHFFIRHDFGQTSPELSELLEQAKCWRVLIEYKGTKDKDKNRSALTEYQLNPMYAPKFGISFRKIRRLPISMKDIENICFGDADEYDKIRKKYIKKWRIDATELQGDLFSND